MKKIVGLFLLVFIIGITFMTYILYEFTYTEAKKEEIKFGEYFVLTTKQLEEFDNTKFFKIEYPERIKFNEDLIIKTFSKEKDLKYIWEVSFEHNTIKISNEKNLNIKLNKKGQYNIILYIQTFDGYNYIGKFVYDIEKLKK